MYSRKYIIVVIYVILLLLIFLLKPSMMFNEKGEIKHFGYNNDNKTSLLSIELIIPILIVISYILYLIIELII